MAIACNANHPARQAASVMSLASAVLATATMTAALLSQPAFANQHTSLDEITPDNVANLGLAFEVRTGDLNQGFRRKGHSFQATPVFWQGRLFISTSANFVIAYDAQSGEEIWRFDPKLDQEMSYSESASRGVSLWHGEDVECPNRVFLGTLGSELIALNAESGKLCQTFGNKGIVDLSEGIRNFRAGEYAVTSPVAVMSDRVIVGSSIGDNGAVELESGIVRAYDAKTGALLWHWDPVPRDKDNPAYVTWAGESASINGGANAWAPISVDETRRLAFIPTSSPSPDFYGGVRKGANRHANSLVALNTDTGEVVWAKQLIHHDLWDYDLPAKPALVTIKRDGGSVAAVVQVNKTGMVFAFDRATGESLYPIENRAVPVSDVPGELAFKTQPFSSISVMDHGPVKIEDAFGVYYFDQKACEKIIREYRNEGIFTPPTIDGTILKPAYAGGINWGGIAFDAERQIGIVNFNQIPALLKLLPRREFNRAVTNGEMPGWQLTEMNGTPYGMARRMFLSEAGIPCTKPPWGSIAAIDFGKGEVLWTKPFGTIEDLAPAIVPNFEWGVPSVGGPLTTATGLIFIGASSDYYLRAFRTQTGDEIWRYRLPTGAHATPMSYTHEGKQYVAIAVGGHGGLGTPRYDALMVFTLSP